MTLIKHLENYLGEIDYGWKGDKPDSIVIAKFKNQPFHGSTTFTTLGLSDYPLDMQEGKQVRQELVFSAYDKFSAQDIASFMASFCDYVISMDQAILRGDVVGPSSPIIDGASVDSIYATIPSIFDSGFSTLNTSSPPTVFVWLVPLLSDEALFVKKNGWSCFEDELEERDPDLWDLNRNSIFLKR